MKPGLQQQPGQLLQLIGWWIEDLDPRRHIMANLSREKLSLRLSQCIVWLYGLYLSAIREAGLLYTTIVEVLMPPAVENTRGENEPCSISRTLSS